MVEGGTDEGVELVVGFAERRRWVVRDCMLRVTQLGFEALLPIRTTGRVWGYLLGGTTTRLTKEVEMTLLGFRRRVLLSITGIGNDIRLLRTFAYHTPTLISILLTTEDGFSFLRYLALQALYGVG